MDIDVRKIARLAMLQIPEDKIQATENDMRSIVAMVEKLPQMDSIDSLLDKSNTMQLRADEIIPSFAREEMLQNVPRSIAGCIVVPKTMEE